MKEKYDYYEEEGYHLFNKGVLQVSYRCLDKLGAVIYSRNRNPLRKGGLYLFQLFFYPVYHIQGVLPLAHDHDPANYLPFSIKLNNPAPHFRTKTYLCHILY